MFRYCPSCASVNIRFENSRVFRCPDCGLVYFHNTAAATALIADFAGRVLFVRRGKEPQAGKLDLPGGFVEPNEGAADGLIRECREETGWSPDPARLRFFHSFPNVYPYKKIVYNTCDLFFVFESERELPPSAFRLRKNEIDGILFVEHEKIDFDEIAFPSAQAALRLYLEAKK
jgi:ADP-ribose pyrophosphatase YjhB (NUDIX family)